MYEAEPLGLWPQEGDATLPNKWPDRIEFYNQTISRHRLNPAELPAHASVRTGALELYRAFGKQQSAKVIGEKAPAYHACLPGVAQVFPQARFVVIWRDPVECCRSAVVAGRENRFFAQKGMMRRMLFGSQTLAHGVQWLRREKMSVHEVAYPEVVADPEKNLRAICEFAQIPFDPQMLDLKGADTSLLPTGKHHDRVRSGVIGRTAEKKDPLPPEFTAKARRYTALWRDQFSDLGFSRSVRVEPRQAKPGGAEKAKDRLVNGISGITLGVKSHLFRKMPLSWWRRLRSGTGSSTKRRLISAGLFEKADEEPRDEQKYTNDRDEDLCRTTHGEDALTLFVPLIDIVMQKLFACGSVSIISRE